MRLEGNDGASLLDLAVIGYETPGDVDVGKRETTDGQTSNWLETEIHVRTPIGWGTSQVACMQTWDAAYFADWLDALSRHRIGFYDIIFPEPNLALRAVAIATHHIRLHVSFILEKPGEWHMDDASNHESSDYYSGEMSIKVSRSSLHTAAESLRAELERFPQR